MTKANKNIGLSASVVVVIGALNSLEQSNTSNCWRRACGTATAKQNTVKIKHCFR